MELYVIFLLKHNKYWFIRNRSCHIFPNFTYKNRESRTKSGQTTEIYSLFDNILCIIIQLTTELRTCQQHTEHIIDVRKAVVNLNLRS